MNMKREWRNTENGREQTGELKWQKHQKQQLNSDTNYVVTG